jgi:hypothetical protein
MGTSTDGQICYGIITDEDNEFPWDGDEFEGDEEEWWAWETGWEPTDECQYSFQWNEKHPMPFKLVNYCSGDFPMWIVAVPETVINANRGYPKSFDPARLTVSTEGLEAFKEFLAKYSIEGDAKWWLSSYWG